MRTVLVLILIKDKEENELRKNIKIDGKKSNDWVCSDGRVYYKSKGYPFVAIGQKTKTLHTLLATAFISNEDPKKNVVDHIDGDRNNHSLDNFQWCTQQQNVERALSYKVAVIDIQGNVLKTFPSLKKCADEFVFDGQKFKPSSPSKYFLNKLMVKGKYYIVEAEQVQEEAEQGNEDDYQNDIIEEELSLLLKEHSSIFE
jgi:hypothetical protein